MYFIELSDWDFRRQNAWFYQLSHKKSDKLLKFTLFKILKIGLDKLLFKKKKIRNKCGNLKNGARYCAIIGLKIMMILKNWEEKLRQFKILINHCQTVVFLTFIIDRITIVFFIFYNGQTKLFFSLILYAVTI